MPDTLQFAADQHGHAVAKHFRIGEYVRREENRSPLPLQLENNVAHLAPPYRIEAGHGLVQKNHLRIVQNGLGNTRALQHPFREFAKLHVGGLR